MKYLFPIEIIENTTESHFAKFSTRSCILYTVVLLFVVVTLTLLPVINIDVTVQSRGIIRSEYETNTLFVSVYGKVK